MWGRPRGISDLLSIPLCCTQIRSESYVFCFRTSHPPLGFGHHSTLEPVAGIYNLQFANIRHRISLPSEFTFWVFCANRLAPEKFEICSKRHPGAIFAIKHPGKCMWERPRDIYDLLSIPLCCTQIRSGSYVFCFRTSHPPLGFGRHSTLGPNNFSKKCQIKNLLRTYCVIYKGKQSVWSKQTFVMNLEVLLHFTWCTVGRL